MEVAKVKNDVANSRKQQIMEKLYLEKDETGDVTFIVEFEKIRAHKSVLAASSPKYKAQFNGLQADQGDIVVEDVTVATFKEFLQLFYLEKPELTTENIAEVLNLAKQSLAENCVNECVLFLSTKVADDACFVYLVALLYDIDKLEALSRKYIRKNTMKVFKSNGFLACDRSILLQILKLDSLNCKETFVFEACISWAKAVCLSKNLDAEDMENLRAELGDTVNEIRFRSMTIEEFVHLHFLHAKFFTILEMQEIMYMIGKLKDFQPSKLNHSLRELNQSSGFNRARFLSFSNTT